MCQNWSTPGNWPKTALVHRSGNYRCPTLPSVAVPYVCQPERCFTPNTRVAFSVFLTEFQALEKAAVVQKKEVLSVPNRSISDSVCFMNAGLSLFGSKNALWASFRTV